MSKKKRAVKNNPFDLFADDDESIRMHLVAHYCNCEDHIHPYNDHMDAKAAKAAARDDRDSKKSLCVLWKRVFNDFPSPSPAKKNKRGGKTAKNKKAKGSKPVFANLMKLSKKELEVLAAHNTEAAKNGSFMAKYHARKKHEAQTATAAVISGKSAWIQAGTRKKKVRVRWSLQRKLSVRSKPKNAKLPLMDSKKEAKMVNQAMKRLQTTLPLLASAPTLLKDRLPSRFVYQEADDVLDAGVEGASDGNNGKIYISNAIASAPGEELAPKLFGRGGKVQVARKASCAALDTATPASLNDGLRAMTKDYALNWFTSETKSVVQELQAAMDEAQVRSGTKKELGRQLSVLVKETRAGCYYWLPESSTALTSKDMPSNTVSPKPVPIMASDLIRLVPELEDQISERFGQDVLLSVDTVERMCTLHSEGWATAKARRMVADDFFDLKGSGVVHQLGVAWSRAQEHFGFLGIRNPVLRRLLLSCYPGKHDLLNLMVSLITGNIQGAHFDEEELSSSVRFVRDAWIAILSELKAEQIAGRKGRSKKAPASVADFKTDTEKKLVAKRKLLAKREEELDAEFKKPPGIALAPARAKTDVDICTDASGLAVPLDASLVALDDCDAIWNQTRAFATDMASVRHAAALVAPQVVKAALKNQLKQDTPTLLLSLDPNVGSLVVGVYPIQLGDDGSELVRGTKIGRFKMKVGRSKQFASWYQSRVDQLEEMKTLKAVMDKFKLMEGSLGKVRLDSDDELDDVDDELDDELDELDDELDDGEDDDPADETEAVDDPMPVTSMRAAVALGVETHGSGYVMPHPKLPFDVEIWLKLELALCDNYTKLRRGLKRSANQLVYGDHLHDGTSLPGLNFNGFLGRVRDVLYKDVPHDERVSVKTMLSRHKFLVACGNARFRSSSHVGLVQKLARNSSIAAIWVNENRSSNSCFCNDLFGNLPSLTRLLSIEMETVKTGRRKRPRVAKTQVEGFEYAVSIPSSLRTTLTRLRRLEPGSQLLLSSSQHWCRNKRLIGTVRKVLDSGKQLHSVSLQVELVAHEDRWMTLTDDPSGTSLIDDSGTEFSVSCEGPLTQGTKISLTPEHGGLEIKAEVLATGRDGSAVKLKLYPGYVSWHRRVCPRGTCFEGTRDRDDLSTEKIANIFMPWLNDQTVENGFFIDSKQLRSKGTVCGLPEVKKGPGSKALPVTRIWGKVWTDKATKEIANIKDKNHREMAEKAEEKARNDPWSRHNISAVVKIVASRYRALDDIKKLKRTLSQCNYALRSPNNKS